MTGDVRLLLVQVSMWQVNARSTQTSLHVRFVSDGDGSMLNVQVHDLALIKLINVWVNLFQSVVYLLVSIRTSSFLYFSIT